MKNPAKKRIELSLQFDELNGGRPFIYRLSFFELGSAQNPTLVLLHGNASRAEEWFKTIGNINDPSRADPCGPLHKDYHLLVVNLPGWGGVDGSDMFGDHDYHFERRIAPTLMAFADQLKLNKFSVIGSSMGAYIAQVWTLKDSRVERLLLFCPPGSTGDYAPGVPIFIHAGAWLYKYGRRLPPLLRVSRFFTRRVTSWVLGRSKFFDPSLVDLLVANLENRERYKASLSYAKTIKDMGTIVSYQQTVVNVHKSVGNLGKPVLHIWSEKDFIVPTKVAKKMSGLMQAKSIVVTSGHMTNIVDPQGSRQLIREFLNNQLPSQNPLRYHWRSRQYQQY